MENQAYLDLKRGERGAIISIIAYICLSILKLVVGYLADSEALKADGLNNATDIISSFAVLIGLNYRSVLQMMIIHMVTGRQKSCFFGSIVYYDGRRYSGCFESDCRSFIKEQ